MAPTFSPSPQRTPGSTFVRTGSTGILSHLHIVRHVTTEDSGEYICEDWEYRDPMAPTFSPSPQRTPGSTFVRTGNTGILRHLHIVCHQRGLRGVHL